MKAALKKAGKVRLDAVLPLPVAADGIRLRVEACGICGTDLQLNPDTAARETAFGHEIAGTIVELGSAVSGLEVGQKVALESASACGRCANCRNARQELCTHIQSFFIVGSFGFAEEMVAPAISAVPCADLSAEVACLSEPLGVAIDMVRLAEIDMQSKVLVLGQGPIGLMATALIRRMGARRIVAVQRSRRHARCRLAGQFGADEVIPPEALEADLESLGGPFDRILVTTPPPTLATAFQVASKGALISFIGMDHGEGAFCRFEVNAFHFKKLQLRASFASPALFTPLALTYLRRGVVDGEALISHRFPLDGISAAMAVARDHPEAVKVVVTP